MASASTVDEYLEAMPDDRRALVEEIRTTVNAWRPPQLVETVHYGMLGWAVPHALYPAGYHCNPAQGVPYASLASQKQKVSLYLFCAYVDLGVAEAFEARYGAWLGRKPDMGASCVRFRRAAEVPHALIAEVLRELTLERFLERYVAGIPASSRPR